MKIRRERRLDSCSVTGKNLWRRSVHRKMFAFHVSLQTKFSGSGLHTPGQHCTTPSQCHHGLHTRNSLLNRTALSSPLSLLWFNSWSGHRARELDSFQVKSNQRCTNCLWVLSPQDQTRIVSGKLPTCATQVLDSLCQIFCLQDPLKMSSTTSQLIHRQ